MLQYFTDNHDTISAITAVASVIIGFLALFVAGLSIWFSNKSLRAQDLHNQLSLLPIPWISPGDYNYELNVKFENKGTGPLIIKELKASNGETTEGDLISFMPGRLSDAWLDFESEFQLQTIRPGKNICLIKLNLNVVSKDFMKEARKALSNIEISVDYTDVYGKVFKTYTKKLDWFQSYA